MSDFFDDFNFEDENCDTSSSQSNNDTNKDTLDLELGDPISSETYEQNEKKSRKPKSADSSSGGSISVGTNKVGFIVLAVLAVLSLIIAICAGMLPNFSQPEFIDHQGSIEKGEKKAIYSNNGATVEVELNYSFSGMHAIAMFGDNLPSKVELKQYDQNEYNLATFNTDNSLVKTYDMSNGSNKATFSSKNSMKFTMLVAKVVSLGERCSIESYHGEYFMFIPKETGKYSFVASEEANFEYFEQSRFYDKTSIYSEKKITAELQAGKLYFIHVNNVNNSYGSLSFVIDANSDSDMRYEDLQVKNQYQYLTYKPSVSGEYIFATSRSQCVPELSLLLGNTLLATSTLSNGDASMISNLDANQEYTIRYKCTGSRGTMDLTIAMTKSDEFSDELVADKMIYSISSQAGKYIFKTTSNVNIKVYDSSFDRVLGEYLSTKRIEYTFNGNETYYFVIDGNSSTTNKFSMTKVSTDMYYESVAVSSQLQYIEFEVQRSGWYEIFSDTKFVKLSLWQNDEKIQSIDNTGNEIAPISAYLNEGTVYTIKYNDNSFYQSNIDIVIALKTNISSGEVEFTLNKNYSVYSFEPSIADSYIFASNDYLERIVLYRSTAMNLVSGGENKIRIDGFISPGSRYYLIVKGEKEQTLTIRPYYDNKATYHSGLNASAEYKHVYFMPNDNAPYHIFTYGIGNGNIDPYLSLYNNGSEIAFSDNQNVDSNANRKNAYIKQNLVSGNSYKLRYRDVYGSGGSMSIAIAREFSANSTPTPMHWGIYMAAFIPTYSGEYTLNTTRSVDFKVYDSMALTTPIYQSSVETDRLTINLVANKTYYIRIYNTVVDNANNFSISSEQVDDKQMHYENLQIGSNYRYINYTPSVTAKYHIFTSNKNSCDPYLELRLNGSQLSYDDDSAGELNALITYQLSANTTYTIGYKAATSSAGTCNLEIARELSSSTVSGVSLIKGTQWFVFKPSENAKYNFRFTNNVSISIYNSCALKTVVGESTNTNSFTTTSSLSTSTTYYIKVSNSSASSNSMSVAKFVNKREYLNLYASTSSSSVTFTPTISGSYKIYTTLNSSSADPKLSLYRGGVYIAEDDDGNGGRNAKIVSNLTAGTTYTINYWSYSGSSQGYINIYVELLE